MNGCLSSVVLFVFVFLDSGGMGSTAKVVYKKLACMIATKYGTTLDKLDGMTNI